LKALSGAKTEIRTLQTGQIKVTIDHDVIRGVTPEMLAWWFENVATLQVRVAGHQMPAYLISHPLDHISFRLDTGRTKRGAQVGDKVHIKEVFARDPRWALNLRSVIAQLDNSGMGLRTALMGQQIISLRHKFDPQPDGTHYRSQLVLGLDRGWLRPIINTAILPRLFPKARATAWMRHTIEEVGTFEVFLPQLWAQRDECDVLTLVP
jgi:hypothetical protein